MQFFGFLITATFYPWFYSAALGSRWQMLCVAVPIALFYTKPPPMSRPRPHWIVVGLLSWATLSLLWTPVIYDGIFSLVQLVIICGCFCLGSACNSLSGFYRGLGYGLVLSSLICIAQFFGYEPVQTVADGAPPSGLFINPDMLGEICIVVLIGLLLSSQYWMAALVLPALILSQSRTAMVAAALCVLAYVVPRARWKSFLAIPLLILMVYAIAPYKWQVSWDGGGRINLWLDTLQGLTFWGHGIGSFYSTFIAYATHVDTYHYQPDTAHNDLLQLAFELGIPVAVLCVGLFVALWKVAGEPERLVLLALAVMGLLAFPLHNPATAAVLAVVAGHAARGWADLRWSVVRRRLSLHDWREPANTYGTGKRGETIPILS